MVEFDPRSANITAGRGSHAAARTWCVSGVARTFPGLRPRAGSWLAAGGASHIVRTTGLRQRTIAVVSTTTVSLSASKECRSGGMTSRSPL